MRTDDDEVGVKLAGDASDCPGRRIGDGQPVNAPFREELLELCPAFFGGRLRLFECVQRCGVRAKDRFGSEVRIGRRFRMRVSRDPDVGDGKHFRIKFGREPRSAEVL